MKNSFETRIFEIGINTTLNGLPDCPQFVRHSFLCLHTSRKVNQRVLESDPRCDLALPNVQWGQASSERTVDDGLPVLRVRRVFVWDECVVLSNSVTVRGLITRRFAVAELCVERVKEGITQFALHIPICVSPVVSGSSLIFTAESSMVTMSV